MELYFVEEKYLTKFHLFRLKNQAIRRFIVNLSSTVKESR
jgi:hypothetical protein